MKSENDYTASNVRRRTINGKVYPNPSTVTAFTDNLSNIPNIESFDVNYYLSNSCHWTNDRLKLYKSENSYRLHTNGHVHDVKICAMDNDYSFISGKCTPEERQSADPYVMWILVHKEGIINSGECTCVA